MLVGAKTLEQFDENLHSTDVNLSKEQLDRLNELTRPRQMYPGSMIERQKTGRDFELWPANWAS